MITAHKLEVRAGARLLMEDVSFRVAAGDKIGLVGRNGHGKTDQHAQDKIQAPPWSLDLRSLDVFQIPFLIRERSIERNGNPGARPSPSPR